MKKLYFPDFKFCGSNALTYLRSKYIIHDKFSTCFDTTAAIIRPPQTFSAEYLDKFPNLDLIASDTTGINHLDGVDKFPQISVKTLRNLSASDRSGLTAASDHAFTLLSLSLRPYLRAFSQLSSSLAVSSTPDILNRRDFIGYAWNDISIGYLGFGRIGQAVFNQVPRSVKLSYYYDINNSIAELNTPSLIRCSSARELFQCADVVLIAITDDPANIRYIDNSLLDQTKIHSIINISRPYMVDEHAIFAKLRSGSLSCYYTDFPLYSAHEDLLHFVTQGSILSLPHMGGCTFASWEKSLSLISSFL